MNNLVKDELWLKKYSDKHKFLTNSMMETLKKEGNLLISRKRYLKGKVSIYKKATGIRVSSADIENVEGAHRRFVEYIKEKTGYDIIIKNSLTNPGDEPCVILEKDGFVPKVYNNYAFM